MENASNGHGISLLPPRTKASGEFQQSEGQFRIEGSYTGRIEGEHLTLIVEEGGRFEGSCRVGELIVRGSVSYDANLVAGRIALLATAIVTPATTVAAEANLSTQAFSMQEGAVLEGNIQTERAA